MQVCLYCCQWPFYLQLMTADVPLLLPASQHTTFNNSHTQSIISDRRSSLLLLLLLCRVEQCCCSYDAQGAAQNHNIITGSC